MFNGVPDQFYQFIASRSALTFPLPSSLPLHVSPPTFSDLDPSASNQIFQSHLLHQLQQSSTLKDEEKEEDRALSGCLELQGVRSISEQLNQWTNEEELALLRIRSTMENGFSYFLWEHVSRKLEELGFKRSAEKCKEKFEELSKYCNIATYNKNYRSFSELEAVYQGENAKTGENIIQTSEGGEKLGLNPEENSGNETLDNPTVEKKLVKRANRKKRKRNHKFELFKGFCEELVNRILTQQEELHNKLLEDVKRREEERVAREEAWKKQEISRLNREIENKAQEQALVSDREARIIELLKKFTSISPSENLLHLEQYEDLLQTPKNPNQPSSPIHAQTHYSISMEITQKNPEIPTNSSKLNNPDSTLIIQHSNSTSNEREEDHGKRWPRDEVNSLINLRCNLFNSNEDKEARKISVWERISQGMLELGYKRSAKRCKEKWENINKYFRKTKDISKKRTSDSKTCPYFHQLSSLYNKETLSFRSEEPENQMGSPENRPELRPETPHGSSQCSGFTEAIVQVPALDFES